MAWTRIRLSLSCFKRGALKHSKSYIKKHYIRTSTFYQLMSFAAVGKCGAIESKIGTIIAPNILLTATRATSYWVS